MGEASPPRLSVVIPAYEEAGRIGRTVERVREALAGVDGGVEVIVVDDGSTDATATAAEAAGADLVVVQPENRGKGAAVRAGMLAATGRVRAFTDADLAYSPEQLLVLLAKVEEGWDVVVGNRQHEDATTVVRARRIRELGSKVVNRCTRLVLEGDYRDTQCGLKAFRGDAAAALFERTRIDGFAFDIEVFVVAERNGWKIAEVPVEVENSDRSTVNLTRDAVRLLRDVLRIRRWAREGRYAAK